jgi:hypothetical protein
VRRDLSDVVASGHGAREHQVVTLEEALRWEPPISTVVRMARRDCELGGIAISAGTNVSVSVAAANRDPEHYPEPDRFDPTRTNIAHLSSAPARMCASECRWPGWRRRWRSTPCSTGRPTYTSTQQRRTRASTAWRSARRQHRRLSSHLPSRASWNIVADSLINGEVDAMSADSPVTGFAIKLSRGELEPATGLRPTLPPETMGNGRLRERPGICRAQ